MKNAIHLHINSLVDTIGVKAETGEKEEIKNAVCEVISRVLKEVEMCAVLLKQLDEII